MFGSSEYQRVPHDAVVEQADEQRRLERLRDRIDRMRDARRGKGRPFDVDGDRISQHLPGQLGNRRRHRRAEEQGLPLGGDMSEDAADVGEKAHIEHSVGFVEHEILERGESGVRRPEVIQQSSGRADDHVDAAPERVFLGSHADPAEHRGGRDRSVNGKIGSIAEDLRGQLARGRQHEHASGATRAADESVENRQEEGGRFSAPRHGGREQVAPVERRRNRLGLDRGRAPIAEILQSLQQRRMELQRSEWHTDLWPWRVWLAFET